MCPSPLWVWCRAFRRASPSSVFVYVCFVFADMFIICILALTKSIRYFVLRIMENSLLYRTGCGAMREIPTESG